MDATAAALSSWQTPFAMTTALAATAAIYARGWHALRAQMPQRFGAPRLVAFLGGLTVVFVAVASPLDAFAGLLLQLHMIQHLLLMMVAPPLLWLGAPAMPLLRGLPRVVAKSALGPFLASPGLRDAMRRLSHPLLCWAVFSATVLVWHLPGPYQLALRAPGWHVAEHLAFLAAGLLFWWPVVQPWPSEAVWPRWTMIPYLLLADVQNTALAAFFAFSDRVLYPHYAGVARLWDVAPLDDQTTAGVLMWVPGSIAFLLPISLIVVELLNARPTHRDAEISDPRAWQSGTARRAAHRLRAGSDVRRFDLLDAPLVGALLRWRYGRRVLQLGMLMLAVAVIVDGLRGPQMAPMNLAGILPWTYWRGLLVVALLAAGNFFCMACPFMLPRELAKRLLPARRAWPRRLRAKWLGAALLVLYLWAYEALAPWDSPWWTAAIALAYFAAAFAVDGLFRGASFCKYVCPIGQFNFINSLASPLAVRVRRIDTCRACVTHDCIRGNDRQRGCELDLFQPEKHGNLDCTFCLDCVAACPHDNVGILAAAPARDLARDRLRSSLRRLSERPDVAMLALVVVFGAFANAAGMTAPVLAWQQETATRLGFSSTLPVFSIGLFVALVVAPAVILTLECGSLLPLWGRGGGVRQTHAPPPPQSGGKPPHSIILALALVPLGLSMWTAHFVFHLATGAGALAPVLKRVTEALIDAPTWAASSFAASPGSLTALQLLLLDGGLLYTLYLAWRISAQPGRRAMRALAVLAPWALLSAVLWVAGVWIVFQPMQMRGMVH
jgi:cytochrome c oxidase assembly factor CtaG